MQDDVHMVGRPFRGLTILTRNSCIHSVSDVGSSINKRAQCISFEYYGKYFLIFNIYLPCAGAVDYDVDVQIIHTFMMDIVQNMAVSNTQILITGDFNVDMESVNNACSINRVKAFIQDCNLIFYLNHFVGDLIYTFRCASRNVYTSIDYIFVPISGICNEFGLKLLMIISILETIYLWFVVRTVILLIMFEIMMWHTHSKLTITVFKCGLI